MNTSSTNPYQDAGWVRVRPCFLYLLCVFGAPLSLSLSMASCLSISPWYCAHLFCLSGTLSCSPSFALLAVSHRVPPSSLALLYFLALSHCLPCVLTLSSSHVTRWPSVTQQPKSMRHLARHFTTTITPATLATTARLLVCKSWPCANAPW